MQRDQDTYGTTPGLGADRSATGSTGAGYGTTGASTAGAGGAGTLGTTGTGAEDESRMHHAADSAREKLGDARERVSEKASDLKATLADKLQSGAQKLRQRNQADGATELGATTSTQRSKVDRATDSLASGMESTANWVRNANVDDMKSGVERQVRENPGRALLVAVGVGYLLGKLFRGGRQQHTS
jgi:hypothetical protein